MQYPLISDYVAAVRNSAGNLHGLSHLIPVQDDHGEPMRSSGAFAVVFKMKDPDTGKFYAMKCFTKDQDGRAEAYRRIADELESVESSYLTSVKYYEKELFVDCSCYESEFPVLLMDWIDGETMDHYIAENRNDKYLMSMLCWRFCAMAAWLRSQPFAHGDIKPDNIMVRPDGSLTLIDYDGMFVPSMKGQTSPTVGTKDFSHPHRTNADFDETIDDFSLASIALSLKAIFLSPTLFDEYASSDHLLFSAQDYLGLSQSKVIPALQPLMADSELTTLFSLFLLAHSCKSLSGTSFRLFYVSEPNVPLLLSTEVTEEDLAEAYTDEFGVKYSKDRRRLLKAPSSLEDDYKILDSVLLVCDFAFTEDGAYEKEEERLYHLSGCSRLTGIDIPNGVKGIGMCAFWRCTGLTSVDIPDSVTEIDDGAFSGCTGLKSVNFPDRVGYLGYRAFSGCTGLTSVEIPAGDTLLDDVFSGCTALTSVKIPDSVTDISYAFSGCTSLTSVEIPDSVTEIGELAFSGCTGLTSVRIPESVRIIERQAFEGCTSLKRVEISNGLTDIGLRAFSGCINLAYVDIPDSLYEILNGAFYGCDKLSRQDRDSIVARFGKKVFEEFIL